MLDMFFWFVFNTFSARISSESNVTDCTGIETISDHVSLSPPKMWHCLTSRIGASTFFSRGMLTRAIRKDDWARENKILGRQKWYIAPLRVEFQIGRSVRGLPAAVYRYELRALWGIEKPSEETKVSTLRVRTINTKAHKIIHCGRPAKALSKLFLLFLRQIYFIRTPSSFTIRSRKLP